MQLPWLRRDTQKARGASAKLPDATCTPCSRRADGHRPVIVARWGYARLQPPLVQIHSVTSLALNMPRTDPVKSDAYTDGIETNKQKNLKQEIFS